MSYSQLSTAHAVLVGIVSYADPISSNLQVLLKSNPAVAVMIKKLWHLSQPKTTEHSNSLTTAAGAHVKALNCACVTFIFTLVL